MNDPFMDDDEDNFVIPSPVGVDESVIPQRATFFVQSQTAVAAKTMI